MTDYKNLKLIASSSPHIRSKDDTRSIMLDVCIALLPALVMSIAVFGPKALVLTLVSIASCVFWEWLYRKLMKKNCSVGDCSAVVTGMLLAFVCPVSLPWCRHRNGVSESDRGGVAYETRLVVKNLITRRTERAHGEIYRLGHADRHENLLSQRSLVGYHPWDRKSWT